MAPSGGPVVAPSPESGNVAQSGSASGNFACYFHFKIQWGLNIVLVRFWNGLN